MAIVDWNAFNVHVNVERVRFTVVQVTRPRRLCNSLAIERSQARRVYARPMDFAEGH